MGKDTTIFDNSKFFIVFMSKKGKKVVDNGGEVWYITKAVGETEEASSERRRKGKKVLDKSLRKW